MNRLIALAPAYGVNLVDKAGIIAVHLIRIDAHYWA